MRIYKPKTTTQVLQPTVSKSNKRKQAEKD